jgi:DNA-binding NtrC family response regulator
LNNERINGFSDSSSKKIQMEARDIIDKEIISYALQKMGWNRSKDQRILDVSYKTLLDRIQHLDGTSSFPLPIPRSIKSE